MIAVSDDIRGIRAITALRSGLLAVTVSVPDPFGGPMVGKLLTVDPRQPFDRNQQVISERNLFEFPFAVAEEPGGTLLVKDQGQQRIIRVDPAAPFSANQTLVASGLPFGSQYDLTVESAASALWSSNADGLLRVDLQTGTFAPVPLTFGCPYGVTMEGSNILFSTSCAQAAQAGIYRLTPAGVRTRMVWSGSSFPAALAVDFTGNIIVGGINGSLWRLHPTTGVLTQIIAPYVGFGLGGYTNSIAVLPPK
jgi:streptogramin lyase